MRRSILWVAVLALVAFGIFWWLSAPQRLVAEDLPNHQGDVANGRQLFFAGGCAACHAAKDAQEGDAIVLSGGMALETPFGPISVPNISPDNEHGIGAWSPLEFANAMTRGISPDGAHYVPAFPWTSYRGMRLDDIIDLKAFMDTLPASSRANDKAGLPFPFSWRRPIGLWKRLFLTDLPAAPAGADPDVERGHYLTVAVGHCGECHTPRTLAFALDTSRWMAGAPSLEGEGRVPNITPSPEGVGEWSAGDLAYLLESGFTPDFDSVGGDMGPVVDNWSKVTDADRKAVAAYLKAIKPLP